MNVLLMCLSEPSGDPRPRRNIDLFNQLNYSVDLVSYLPKDADLKYDNIYIIKTKSTSPFKKISRYLQLSLIFFLQMVVTSNSFLDYLNNLRFLLTNVSSKITKKYNFIIVEDLFLLPLAFKIKNGAKIIFDVREYYPKQLEVSFFFRLFEQNERYRLCKLYLKQCDYLFTVSEGLAKEYKKEFNIDMQILLSVPAKKEHAITRNEKIKLVHHGVANWNRKIENMIYVFNNLDDRFTLDFFLTGDKDYINKLVNISATNKRITFNEPVHLNEITSTINKFDIGFFYVEPTTFNLLHCLPNKFFEFVQANLMIAIGPSPDMMNLVKKYNCGIISEKFSIESMSTKLNALTIDKVQEYKSNSSIASKELCFEYESKKILNILKIQ